MYLLTKRTRVLEWAAVIVMGIALQFTTGCIADHIAMWEGVDRAVARLEPTGNGTATGTVSFVQGEDIVEINAHVQGLEPGSTHAIHIHEYGDTTSSDGKSAGGHYNPGDKPHGRPPSNARHAGDLGSLTADANGNADYHITVDNLSVAELTNPIIGRAVVIHAKADTGAQPSGDAGDRIAFGVIGIANPQPSSGIRQ